MCATASVRGCVSEPAVGVLGVVRVEVVLAQADVGPEVHVGVFLDELGGRAGAGGAILGPARPPPGAGAGGGGGGPAHPGGGGRGLGPGGGGGGGGPGALLRPGES